MNTIAIINNLSIGEQRKLYLWLKAKFDPDSSDIHANEEFAKQLMFDKKIDDLQFPISVYNVLRANSIETIEQLCNCKRSELLKWKNFGKASAQQVEEVLKEWGLNLKPE